MCTVQYISLFSIVLLSSMLFFMGFFLLGFSEHMDIMMSHDAPEMLDVQEQNLQKNELSSWTSS